MRERWNRCKHQARCGASPSFLTPANTLNFRPPGSAHPALPRLSLGPGLDDKFRFVSLTTREIRIHLLRFCLTFHGHCLSILQKPILLADAPFTIYSVLPKWMEPIVHPLKFSTEVLATMMRTSLPPQILFTRSSFLHASYPWREWPRVGNGWENPRKFRVMLSPLHICDSSWNLFPIVS